MKYIILFLICLISNKISSNIPEEIENWAQTEESLNDLLKNYTNPTGLINTPINWDFEIKNNKGKFEKFINGTFGLRAGMKNLYNAIKFKKVKNNYELIKRHNNEEKYINSFFNITKLSRTSLINNDTDFIKLIKTIVFLETSILINERDIEKIKNNNFFYFKNN